MAGIYVHIPFCKTRCSYCDFYSTLESELPERYVSAVAAEGRLRQQELDGENVLTAYVGGGTPSQLTLEQMQRLVNRLNDTFDLSNIQEFTVEVNPDDVSTRYIEGLAKLGVNRISMGVQSFVDSELRAIGRRHTALQAIKAVDDMRQAGITNVSIDLIFGLPGQTLQSWEESLMQAVKLRPDHISAYALSYEPGTRLWLQRERGEVQEAPEELSISMYDMLTQVLKNAGYEHYEISNFALPHRHSRHNSSYWAGTPYLGLGASAHSFDGMVRRYNPADIRGYITAIERGETCYETESLTWQEKYDEMVMVRLRTAHGIDLDEMERSFGKPALEHFMQEARPHLHDGRLMRTGNRMSLTAEGIMVSDAIIRDLMW